jgi:hypothetical protein
MRHRILSRFLAIGLFAPALVAAAEATSRAAEGDQDIVTGTLKRTRDGQLQITSGDNRYLLSNRSDGGSNSFPEDDVGMFANRTVTIRGAAFEHDGTKYLEVHQFAPGKRADFIQGRVAQDGRSVNIGGGQTVVLPENLHDALRGPMTDGHAEYERAGIIVIPGQKQVYLLISPRPSPGDASSSSERVRELGFQTPSYNSWDRRGFAYVSNGRLSYPTEYSRRIAKVELLTGEQAARKLGRPLPAEAMGQRHVWVSGLSKSGGGYFATRPSGATRISVGHARAEPRLRAAARTTRTTRTTRTNRERANRARTARTGGRGRSGGATR